MSYQNGGADPLSYGYFQAYSNIKRSIRREPQDLLATKGIATAALTLPESEAQASSRVQAKRQRLRRQLLGQTTPEDPDASKPFAREQRLVDAAVQGEEFAFRMKQVIHVQVSHLARPHRRFDTVLQPILQLMRFFSLRARTIHTPSPFFSTHGVPRNFVLCSAGARTQDHRYGALERGTSEREPTILWLYYFGVYIYMVLCRCCLTVEKTTFKLDITQHIHRSPFPSWQRIPLFTRPHPLALQSPLWVK